MRNQLPDNKVDAVLTAWSSWKDKRPFEFTIIGDGVCLQPCIRLAEKLGIADSCRFTGRLTREQTLEEFRKAEVFVMISSPETLGLVYLEAMSQGCVAIGSRNEGMSYAFLLGNLMTQWFNAWVHQTPLGYKKPKKAKKGGAE